jgi:hypothetical protein
VIFKGERVLVSEANSIRREGSGRFRAGHVKGLREGENEPYFTIARSSARLALAISRSFRMLSR